MRVLVVEDSNERASKILAIASLVPGLDTQQIVLVPDVAGAKRELKTSQYDVLIVDIQVPIRFGEAAKVDGGIRLVEELTSGSSLNRPSYMLGLTQYDESFAAATQPLFRSFAGVLHALPDSTGWEVELRSFLTQTLAATQLRSTGEQRVDMVIVCALNEPELQGLVQCESRFLPLEDADGCMIAYKASLDTVRGPKSVVAACALEMGMAAAAALSAKLIERYKPRYIVISGIAGGVQGEVAIGDIVVADMVWDYSSGKLATDALGEPRFEPEPRVIPLDPFAKRQMVMFMSDPKVLKDIQAAWEGPLPSPKLSVHLAPMFTGALVVANQAKVTELTFTHRKLKGIEMEAYGVFCAAKYADAPQPVALAIKSVSDLADHAKDDAWRRYATHTASRYLLEWAIRHL
jgi:nucleoside phosphorylase/CheY-like chemotaxis protein